MDKIVVFHIGDYGYGFPVEKVKEIIRIVAFKPLPNQPPFVEGVFNLRSRIIPLIDFRRRFLMGITEKDLAKRIIIVKYENFLAGFLVDRADEIREFSADEIKNLSGGDIGLDFKYVDKIALMENEMIAILNINKIFSPEEIAQLNDFISTNDSGKEGIINQ